jgi:hypothetical protein
MNEENLTMSDDPNPPGSQPPQWEDPTSQPQQPAQPPPQQPQAPPPQPAPQQPQAPPQQPQYQQPTPPQQYQAPPPEAQQPAQAQAQPDVQPMPGPQPTVPFPLQQSENVLQIVRRHWWFLWPFTIWLVIVAFVPMSVAYWFFDLIGIADDLNWFFWVPALLWIGYWGIRALFNWYRYQNDIWVVTNQRIVDVFRSNPFNKRVTTADLVNIQDMRVERRGVTATIFGFSDLLCSTAGTEGGTFNISGVPQAEELQLLIDKERDRERMRRV